MRVLHLYNTFGLLTERVMLQMPLALAGRGHQIIGACERLADNAPAVTWPMHRLDRVLVDATDDIDGQMRRVSEKTDDAALARLLDEPIDLVHGHFGPRILHALRFLRRDVPVVISLYGYDISRLTRDPAWPRRYRWAAEHGAIFVVLTQSARQRLLGFGVPEDAIRVIHLGVMLPDWPYHGDAAPLPGAGKFVFIGRFTHKKAPQDIITAMARLRDAGIDATIDLVGGGELEADLHEQVAAMDLDDRVQFRGYVKPEQLIDTLRHATAFVLPSAEAPDGDMEGMPLILMQAAAMGLPCITTRHAGNPEVIPPAGQRFVVPVHDPAALADAMAAMIRLDPGERETLQRAGRQWIEQRFDFEKTVTAYDDLYHELTATAPAIPGVGGRIKRAAPFGAALGHEQSAGDRSRTYTGFYSH